MINASNTPTLDCYKVGKNKTPSKAENAALDKEMNRYHGMPPRKNAAGLEKASKWKNATEREADLPELVESSESPEDTDDTEGADEQEESEDDEDTEEDEESEESEDTPPKKKAKTAKSATKRKKAPAQKEQKSRKLHLIAQKTH